MNRMEITFWLDTDEPMGHAIEPLDMSDVLQELDETLDRGQYDRIKLLKIIEYPVPISDY